MVFDTRGGGGGRELGAVGAQDAIRPITAIIIGVVGVQLVQRHCREPCARNATQKLRDTVSVMRPTDSRPDKISRPD